MLPLYNGPRVGLSPDAIPEKLYTPGAALILYVCVDEFNVGGVMVAGTCHVSLCTFCGVAATPSKVTV